MGHATQPLGAAQASAEVEETREQQQQEEE